MGSIQCGSSGGHLQIQCSHQHLQMSFLSKNFKMYFFYLKAPLDFPGGPVVKNPLVNAEDTGFSSWSEPYARGQLSLWASATEALLCTEKPLP